MARLRASTSRSGLLLAGLLLAAVVLVLTAPVFMLAMAPAIGVFAMVAHRVMPGERLIVRLRERHAPRRRRAPAAVQRPYGVIVVRRTGRLLAAALAMRPPPRRCRSPASGARFGAEARACAPGPCQRTEEDERVRAQQPTRRGASLATRACIAGALAAAAHAAPAAAAPAPCGGVAQIADAVGDGHHNNTDVTAAWLSEQAGRLQAVIQPRAAVWEPAHDESDAAGFALLYTAGGELRYVRAVAPRGPARFDHGTWSAAGGFAAAGATTGQTVAGPGGSVTIDVPALAPGTVLTRLFALTYDGGTGADLHWVDRAPGGAATPAGTEFGADYVVGACGGPLTGTPGPGGGAVTTTAVQLDAPRRIVGGGSTQVGGRVAPARAGVSVQVTATARRSVVRRAVTQADGSFSLLLPIGETTGVRAVAESIASQTRTITVVSKVRIRVRRRAGGAAVVRGTVRPRLPGRVLLLRRGAVEATATAQARDGRFRIRLSNPRRGRYQAVFIPRGKRAERSTSNTGAIR